MFLLLLLIEYKTTNGGPHGCVSNLVFYPTDYKWGLGNIHFIEEEHIIETCVHIIGFILEVGSSRTPVIFLGENKYRKTKQ